MNITEEDHKLLYIEIKHGFAAFVDAAAEQIFGVDNLVFMRATGKYVNTIPKLLRNDIIGKITQHNLSKYENHT